MNLHAYQGDVGTEPTEGRDFAYGRTFRFVVYGEAKPQGSKRAWFNQKSQRVQMLENSNVGDWRKRVAQAAGEQCGAAIAGQLIEGPCALSIVVYRPRPKSKKRARFAATAPDASKLLRGIEDALTGILYVDDSRIVDDHIRKLYGEPARAEVVLREILETR